jgi:formylglycine-generating enzyme required for sulfatase activity
MHGNVFEWCEDVYDPLFYDNPNAGGPNPVSTAGSEFRGVRGSSFVGLAAGFSARDCRSAGRFKNRPENKSSTIGFRPAAPAP